MIDNPFPASGNVAMSTICRTFGRNRPASLAFVDGTSRVTYREFDAQTTKLASALRKSGVRKGDRVAALLRDGLPLLDLYFACAKIGAIIVPLNWRLAPAEIAYIGTHSQPKFCFVSPRFQNLAEKAELTAICLEVPDDEPYISGAYARLLAEGTAQREAETISGDDPWIMLYTSGTTGRPKGCLLSHHGQFSVAQSIALAKGLTARDILVTTAPLFHVGGLSGLLAHYVAGATIVIAPHPIDAQGVLELMHHSNCTEASFPATLRDEIARLQREKKVTLALKRITTAGTTLVDMDSFRAFKESFEARLNLGYGQTEVGGFATFMDGDDQLARPQACGKVMPHLDMQIIDEFDQPLPVGQAGELCLRGASVMIGYWQNPQATSETLRKGWLHTGDIFRMDDDGYIHFVGRKKELIKSGGENVYPAEVELVLMTHPDVQDCAVVGVPDARWSEAVKAFVVLKPGRTLPREELVGWCRKDLAGYKRPRYVEFVDLIPRSALGKIERLTLSRRPVTPDQAV